MKKLKNIEYKDIDDKTEWLICIECGEEWNKLEYGLCPNCKLKKDMELENFKIRKQKEFWND